MFKQHGGRMLACRGFGDEQPSKGGVGEMRWAHLDLAGPLTSPPHGLHARLEGVELCEEHL